MSSSDLIYFDQAATSYPKPPCVREALIESIQTFGGNPGRSSHRLSVCTAERIFSVREKLSLFFGAASPESVVFTRNATEAINLALFSALRNGDHVLCSDLEHNAVIRPLFHLKSIGKIEYDIFSTKDFSPERLSRLCKKNTRMLVLNHASNVCGIVQPAKEIGDFCHENGILFLLDASQSAGHIPIDVQEMHIDMLCAPAHKGLYGIMGAGFIIFSTKERFPAFMHGGSGTHSFSLEMPLELPERYEAGTLNVPAIVSLGAALTEIERRGVARIGSHISEMEEFLSASLAKQENVHVYEAHRHGSGILSFTHDRFSPSELADRLDRANIAVRSGFHCAPLAHRSIGSERSGTVRIGLGMTNTHEECVRFLSALKETCKNN